MARSFNGSSQYFNTSTSPVSALPLTVACWFRSASDSAVQVLLALGNGSGTERVFLTASGNAAGDPVSFQSITTAGTAGAAVSLTGYSINTWHHIAGVTAAVDSRYVYLDGVQSPHNTQDRNASPATWDHVDVASNFFSSSRIRYLDGQIAEVAIWNAALTSGEISSLAAGYAPPFIRPQNLVCYWPMHGRAGAAGNEDPWYGTLPLLQAASPSLADHPRIIYPGRGQRVFTPGAAVAGFRAAWVPRQAQFIGGR